MSFFINGGLRMKGFPAMPEFLVSANTYQFVPLAVSGKIISVLLINESFLMVKISLSDFF
jgi:hypothetical protein